MCILQQVRIHVREKFSWLMNSNSIRIHIRQKIVGNAKCINSRVHGRNTKKRTHTYTHETSAIPRQRIRISQTASGFRDSGKMGLGTDGPSPPKCITSLQSLWIVRRCIKSCHLKMCVHLSQTHELDGAPNMYQPSPHPPPLRRSCPGGCTPQNAKTQPVMPDHCGCPSMPETPENPKNPKLRRRPRRPIPPQNNRPRSNFDQRNFSVEPNFESTVAGVRLQLVMLS